MTSLNLSPIYLFHGEEDFLISEEILAIQNKALNLYKDQLLIRKLDADAIPIHELTALISQSSLFSSNRLIVIDNYDFEESDTLIPALKNIPPDLILILISKKIDSRKKIIKYLKDAAVVLEFKPFAPWEQYKLTSWISKRVGEYGKTINSEAAAFLGEICGTSLRQLSAEIEKIVTYLGDGSMIRKENVIDTAVSGQIHAFSLLDAISARDLTKALFSLNKMLSTKERPEVIIGSIAARVRTYLLVKQFENKNIIVEKAAQELGISPYYFKQCLKASALYEKEELLSALKMLHKTDLNLKTRSQSAHISLELALIEIISAKNK